MPGKDGLRAGLIALATRYNLPSLALQASSGSSQPRRDAGLYPLMPWQPNGGYTSDPALVLAVAKNESRFNHEARSPAGAMGVMQVMPQTAESMTAGASKRLYDPEYNVTLGDRYLNMLTRTDGVKDNLLLIIGSYNWGPDRAVRYYNASMQRKVTDPLLFLESLPITETRQYIQKVMATYWVYRARFNKPLTAMVELAVGRWPRYKADDGLKLTQK
jgi:soluble lytic murein transglycosylase-like protein